MEAIYRDYSARGVRFFYLYKALAHPEYNGYVKPVSIEERLLHVKEAERTIGSEIPWLCDTMDNALKHALGDAPNCEFVIDPEGKIARLRVWSEPEQLRADLEKLVGPVGNPTDPADIKLETQPPPKVAPSGVVPRVERLERSVALKSEPDRLTAKHPFYVKLRAEAERELLQTGFGRLYLGFHLDPIYRVHWNNLVAPVEYEIEAPEEITIVPKKAKGPKVGEPSDIDPREFLLDVYTEGFEEPLFVTVRYFACNDEEGWCKPVTQKYKVHLQEDPDGGWTLKRRARGERDRRQRRR